MYRSEILHAMLNIDFRKEEKIMSKLSWILVVGLFACVLAVLFRDDTTYQAAYSNLHSRRLSFDDFDEDVQ